MQIGGELNGHNTPFTIGIQSRWQTSMMMQYGHQSGIIIDDSFETNENKVNILLNSIQIAQMNLYYLNFNSFTMCSFHCT